jgi:DNA polymerase III alpha subunit (gram-positive type)
VKAFIFDTETTGLVKNSLVPLEQQPRVIEFFGHTVDDETGETLDEIEFFCDPGIPLEQVITRITGIKAEDLKGAKPFRDHAHQICAAIASADAVVAHNLSFDMALIEADCQRAGCAPEWPERLICTVEQTEWIRSHRLSLTALHEELFGEGFPSAHRARHDVEALTRCYLELRKRGDI